LIWLSAPIFHVYLNFSIVAGFPSGIKFNTSGVRSFIALLNEALPLLHLGLWWTLTLSAKTKT